ncbi:hypothetical protein LB505_010840 [Fusarium chuoi]|nr:hypothetical protein LB505_010840 [Fusarium chuoi]
MPQSLLLQNGLVIQHDEHDSVLVVENTDILIVDGIIKQIGKSIKPPPHAEVVDCSNKIISPRLLYLHFPTLASVEYLHMEKHS